MKITIVAAALAGMALATGAHAQVAKVNGVAIPQQRLDFFVRNFVAQGQQDTPELRDAIKNELINRELLVQEAVRRGLHKNPDVAMQIEIRRMEVLFGALMQEVLKGRDVSEDAVKQEYERAKGQFGAKEYRVRHILVEKEDDAKAIIARISGGASFEKLAAERSKDQGSRKRGGELDWSPAGRYVKPFGDAIARLKKGQMTEAPVQTPFGWHVIRLEDERPLKPPPYDQVKGNLQRQMQQRVQKEAFDKILAELRGKAKIE